MADPAWGTASPLSDEETARALCAFHHTEPLPTQRRRPLHQQQQQQQQPPYRARDERSRQVPQLAPGGGFSAFGYPPSGAYYMAPVAAQPDDAASVLARMHGPSASSDEWQRQQQRRIQDELEQQQRELQALAQRQQQHEMHMQLQHLQAQIQQQQQEQAHRRVERVQEPRYSTGFGGSEQSTWATPSFGGADSYRNQGTAISQGRTMQQNGRLYDGDFQRTQPVPMRPTTTPTGGRSYAFNYGDDSQAQAGVSAGRNDVLFAPQQVPQPAQSHFRARNTDLFAASG
ncbi:uncharacterized protein IUM83_16320 [Phytophthora cinnamomi]|uniref:uncharacterized protein n=1 Tax=Phytophthora cinnamomi TaxID=4785 RepID=UPI003559F0CC|nr:hypothetical protein IUM83_16320 [Phytophthora cinnamomi]